jgi:hypothetical protein
MSGKEEKKSIDTSKSKLKSHIVSKLIPLIKTSKSEIMLFLQKSVHLWVRNVFNEIKTSLTNEDKLEFNNILGHMEFCIHRLLKKYINKHLSESENLFKIRNIVSKMQCVAVAAIILVWKSYGMSELGGELEIDVLAGYGMRELGDLEIDVLTGLTARCSDTKIIKELEAELWEMEDYIVCGGRF